MNESNFDGNRTAGTQGTQGTPAGALAGQQARAALVLHEELARRDFGRWERVRPVMHALIDWSVGRGLWPLRLCKGFDELAALVPGGLAKNHCGAYCRRLAALGMVDLNWLEAPGLVVVRVECDARRWHDVALVCDGMSWSRRVGALWAVNGRVQGDLIEPDPVLARVLMSVNRENLDRATEDAPRVGATAEGASDAAFFSGDASRGGKFSRAGKLDGLQLPAAGSSSGRGDAKVGCGKSSMITRPSCADGNGRERGGPSRARARSNSNQINIGIENLPIQSMERNVVEALKVAIADGKEREFCAAACQVMGPMDWLDGRKEHWIGEGGKWRLRFRHGPSTNTVRAVFLDMIETGNRGGACAHDLWIRFGGFALDAARKKLEDS